MKVATYEGIIENGRVRLLDNIPLPEKSKVYVVVPDREEVPIRYVRSPRLAHPRQAADFQMEVVEVTDASV